MVDLNCRPNQAPLGFEQRQNQGYGVAAIRGGSQVTLSDTVHCLFSARVERRDGSAVVEIPENELALGSVEAGEVYRVALVPAADSGTGSESNRRTATAHTATGRQPRSPPVAEGDVREVEIEGIGDQGDGIAKVDRGFVVIVPETEPGDRVEVEIESVYDNFALASVVDGETTDSW